MREKLRRIRGTLTEEHAGFLFVLDDAAGIDVSKARTFFENGYRIIPDCTFRCRGVFKVVGSFEVNKADLCDRIFGHYEYMIRSQEGVMVRHGREETGNS